MIFKGSYIEITNRCNLNCRDCYNSSGKNKVTVELDLDVLLKYVEELIVIYNAKSITFSGGEPLLYTKIDSLLDALEDMSARFPDVEFAFVTNGTLYNKKLYDLLENNKQFFAQISLDGPTEDSCATMRGAGTFTKVLENVKQRKFLNKPFFKMIINKANASYVEDYFHFVYDELGGVPSYAFTSLLGNAVENWEEMNISTAEKVKILTIVQKKYLDNNIKEAVLPVPTVHCDLLDADGEREFCIKADGSIQPCQNFYDDKFCIGNIYNLDWKVLCDNFDKLSAYLTARMEIDYGCQKCYIKSVCGRGCPAFAFIENKDALSSDMSCEFRRLATINMIKTKKTV